MSQWAIWTKESSSTSRIVETLHQNQSEWVSECRFISLPWSLGMIAFCNLILKSAYVNITSNMTHRDVIIILWRRPLSSAYQQPPAQLNCISDAAVIHLISNLIRISRHRAQLPPSIVGAYSHTSYEHHQSSSMFALLNKSNISKQTALQFLYRNANY